MLNKTIFQDNLEQICIDFKTTKFLLAISGGVDSMVLFYLFKELHLEFEVAHINYKLRGEDSEKDQNLVEEICLQHHIPFHGYQVSNTDRKPKNSIQEWARNLRYNFFRKIQENRNLEFIVTAHHLNDQLETFLINLSKASGIKGLSGIPANDNQVLRPLLSFSKDEIYDFAKENIIEFREDVSNKKNDYLRNQIRNTIVPELVKVNHNFLENFGKSISYLNQTKNFLQDQISKIENELLTQKDGSFILEKKLFLQQSDFIQFEILQKFGFTTLEEITKIKNAEKGKNFFSKQYQIFIDRDVVIIRTLVNEADDIDYSEVILEINDQNELIFPTNFRTEMEELGGFNWKIDLKKVKLPLKLRPQKQGDLFYPIGMIGKKKIAKFFKDEKIPNLAKQKIKILSDGNDQILGIIPYRQDRRFAANKESKQVIKVKLVQS